MAAQRNMNSRRFRLSPLAACLLALLAGGAAAQDVPASDPRDPSANPLTAAPPGPPPRYWIEPRVFVTQSYSDNFLLSNTNRQSEWTTELGAGVTALWNLPRLQGNVDYSISGLYYARGTADERFAQAFNGQVLMDVWNNLFFVEADGAIGDERVSAFGVQPTDQINPLNTAESRRFRVSPFLRGTLADAVAYEARFTQQAARSDALTRSDIDERSWGLTVGSADEDSRFGWELAASRSDFDYSLGRSLRFDQATALGRYSLSSTLQVFLQGGRESNDLLTSTRTSYNYSAAGFDWRPTETARVSASRSNRYFGSGHNVQLEYRFNRVVLGFIDTRDVNTNQLTLGEDSGNLGNLLDNLYQGVESDPVRRAQLVQAELQRLGLPADLTAIPGYLTSTVTLQRNQQISAALLTARGVLTLTIERTASRRLDTSSLLGDDFDLSDEIDERGWSVAYAHRLTPRLSLATVYRQRRTEGLTANLENRLQSFTVALSARLAPRTIGSVALRRSSYKSTSPYQETAVQATLVHRF